MPLNKAFAPAMKLMGRFRFPAKFAIIALVFSIPLALVQYYFQHEINHNIEFASDEIGGVAYSTPVSQFMEDALFYQERLHSRALDKGALSAESAALKEKAEQDIAAVDAVDARMGAHLKASADWKKLKEAWESLNSKADSLSPDKTRDAFNDFMGQTNTFITTLGNNSNLILDPDIDSYYTMDTVLTQHPNLHINLAQARDLAANIVQAKKITTQEKVQLAVLMERVNLAMGNINSDLKQVQGFNASVKDSTEQARTPLDKSVTDFMGIINTKFINADKVSGISRGEIIASGNGVLHAGQTYRASAMGTLKELLEKRRGGFYSRRLFVSASTCTALLLGSYLFFGFYLLTTRSLRDLVRVSQRLAVGDVEHDIVSVSRDEIAEVEGAFRKMVAYQTEAASVASVIAEGDLTASIQPKDSKDVLGNAFSAMLQNLRRLISEVAHHSEAVAETSVQLALASDQTGRLASDISHSMQEVSSAASQSATTSQEMATGSEQQAQAASEAAGAMERLQSAVLKVQQGGAEQQKAVLQADAGMQQASQALKEVARSAKQMTATAQEATSIAKTGGDAVEKTIGSMNRIKAQIENASEKVVELGEQGRKIGAITETIDQIAAQTNLLALNAAIEAARAGEHGRGFAVVADEVRKLAERATNATKEISALISSVQAGVDESVQAMQTSREVALEGAERSVEAGAALSQILQTVEGLAAKVEEVTATSEKMGGSVEMASSAMTTVHRAAEANERSVSEMIAGSERVSTAIATVAAISEETAAGAEEMSASAEEVAASAHTVSSAGEEQTASIEEVSASVNELKDMATQLQELVSQFKVEEERASPIAAKAKSKTKLRRAA